VVCVGAMGPVLVRLLQCNVANSWIESIGWVGRALRVLLQVLISSLAYAVLRSAEVTYLGII
jgi:hypothetical protein